MFFPLPCHDTCPEYLGRTIEKNYPETSESFKTTLIWVNSTLDIQVNVLGFLLLKHPNIILEISVTISQ